MLSSDYLVVFMLFHIDIDQVPFYNGPPIMIYSQTLNSKGFSHLSSL